MLRNQPPRLRAADCSWRRPRPRFQWPSCSACWSNTASAARIVCPPLAVITSRSPRLARPAARSTHLVACGAGLERIAEEIDSHFPDARTIVLSSDMLGGVKAPAASSLEAIAKGEAESSSARSSWPRDTISRNEPGGVIDADLGLAQRRPGAPPIAPSMLLYRRSPAGPGARAQEQGFIQTTSTDNPVMRAWSQSIRNPS